MSVASDDEMPTTPWRCVDATCTGYAWHIITLPWRLVFYITIPDTRRTSCRSTLASIISSISITTWLCMMLWHLVWMCTEMSVTMRIPSIIMGIVVLAAGES